MARTNRSEFAPATPFERAARRAEKARRREHRSTGRLTGHQVPAHPEPEHRTSRNPAPAAAA